VSSVLRLDFTVSSSPIDALADFAARADELFAAHGFEVEGRGKDWAHWTADDRIVRAYLFKTHDLFEEGPGISLIGPMPAPLAQRLSGLAAELFA
jgi:hypothetical protein